MGDTLRIGIIGTGKHGSRYGHHISEDLKDIFSLSAIARRSEEGKGQAAHWGCRYHSDWRDLICDPSVDAVICAVTPNLNLAIGKFCAAHNKPLLLEKPIDTDYYRAAELIECFQKASLKLTVGQTLRYNEVILALQQELTGLGELYGFSASQRLEPSSLSWLEDPDIAGAGVIFHTGVHLFDAIAFITGEPIAAVRAVSRKIHNWGVEDMVAGEIRLRSGGIGTFDTSKVSPSRLSRYEFICDGGQLAGDQIHGNLERITGMQVERLPVKPPGPTILPLLRDWYDFLKDRGKNPVPPEAGLAAVKTCHACRKSVETGGWCELDAL